MIRMGSLQEEYSANGFTGDGMTTAAQTQTGNVPASKGSGVKTESAGTENVLGAWLLVAAVLVGITLLLENFSSDQTYSQVKIGFYNMVVIGFYSLLFITLGKVFFAKVRIPGLTALFMSA